MAQWVEVGRSIPTLATVTAEVPLKQGTVPPCSPGALNGCPPLQCMASVSECVTLCMSTGANLDGLKAEDKFRVYA